MVYSKTPVRAFDVSELSFMVGGWRGRSDDDIFEEHWMPLIENNMTGMFRWLKKGEVYVYEIMAFVKHEDDVRFLLRHFSKTFEGWEEKNNPIVLVLTELNENQGIFVQHEHPEKGFLTYERIDEGTLRFADLEPDGSVSFELIFHKL